MSDPAIPPPPSPGRIRLYEAIRRLRPIQLGEAVKRLLRIRRFPYRLPDGRLYWIDPVSNMGLFLLQRGAYEIEMENVLRRVLAPGETFLDVGANEGYFTVLAAALVGPTGQVHAFEPQARLHPVLRRNAELNNARDTIRIHGIGLSDEPGTATLHLTPDVNTGASSLTRHWRIGTRSQTIQLDTLDRLAHAHHWPQIHVLKIDCEGAEPQVLAGATHLLTQKRIQTILLEYHPRIIGDAECERLHERLVQYGYREEEADFGGATMRMYRG